MPDDEQDVTALERALSAPGTPAELADEAAYVAMFRAAVPVAAPTTPVAGVAAVAAVTQLRTARRLGTTAAAVVVLAVATGGVAAAYTSSLPAPVQRAVHSVLAPLGVPQAEPKDDVTVAPRERQQPSIDPTPTPVAPQPSPSDSHRPRPSGSPSPTAPVPSATPTEVIPSETPTLTPTVSPTPTADPSTTDSASPTPSPTETVEPTPSEPPAPVPAAVTISSVGADQQVAPGGTAVVTGAVTTADGSPVPGVRVVLQARGAQGWYRMASATSGGDGSVAASTGPVQRSTQVRLRARGLSSATWRLVVQPSVSATTETVDQTATVAVTTNGGQSGDRVLLLTRRNGQLVQEGAARLDGAGRASFAMTAPPADRVYVVRLVGTAGHAEASTQVRVAGVRTPESGEESATSPG